MARCARCVPGWTARPSPASAASPAQAGQKAQVESGEQARGGLLCGGHVTPSHDSLSLRLPATHEAFCSEAAPLTLPEPRAGLSLAGESPRQAGWRGGRESPPPLITRGRRWQPGRELEPEHQAPDSAGEPTHSSGEPLVTHGWCWLALRGRPGVCRAQRQLEERFVHPSLHPATSNPALLQG